MARAQTLLAGRFLYGKLDVPLHLQHRHHGSLTSRKNDLLKRSLEIADRRRSAAHAHLPAWQ
jgi:hypothetical protein